ncbi:hypothetical protein [Spirillospora sp. CA-294931]|uniref:hypothetical protein n=1 Tax=Spirillospora sp. CA-294931 TaxID=3240042 RepID=UPI003D8FCF40
MFTLVAVVAAIGLVVDPLHLANRWWMLGGVIAVAGVLGTLAVGALIERVVVRSVVVCVGVAGALLAGAGLSAVHAALKPTVHGAVAKAESGDGRYKLIVERGRFSNSAHTEWRVRLRTGSGLFARQKLAWEPLKGTPPNRVYFVGSREFEVAEDKCVRRYRFDRTTLDVTPLGAPCGT